MKIRIFLVLLAFSATIKTGWCQGKIVMLNGKEKPFQSAEVKGDIIEYQPLGTSKPIFKKVDKFDVFSIYRDSSGEEIVYSPDTVAGEDPTISEVRDYIIGERYAAFSYKNPANFVTGLEVGIVSGFTLPIFYGVGIPIIYSIGFSQFTPKIVGPLKHDYNDKTGLFTELPTDSTISNINFTNSFEAGYGKKARNIRFKKSLLGGSIGFVVGVTAISIIKNSID